METVRIHRLLGVDLASISKVPLVCQFPGAGFTGRLPGKNDADVRSRSCR
jgi:hypothetical protein